MNQTILLSLLLIFGLSMTGCGPTNTPNPNPNNTSSPTSSTPEENLQGDPGAQALLKHQRDNFPRIINELNTDGRKTSHWIWWIFPTKVSGASEPLPKSNITMNNIDYVLTKANLEAWTIILEKIASLLAKHPMPQPRQPNPNIIPSIDHGRISHALAFWLGEAKPKIKAHPRFLRAFEQLQKYRWH